MVLFIHRPALLGLTEEQVDQAELSIAKNRAGETAIIDMTFNGDLVKFTESSESLSGYAERVAQEYYKGLGRKDEGYQGYDPFERP